MNKNIIISGFVFLLFLTGCYKTSKEIQSYMVAMVNKSGQKVTVKNVPFRSNIPDFFILAPNDSVSWSSEDDMLSRSMEIYFNDVFYKKYNNQSWDKRSPHVLWNYEINSDGVYVFSFTPEDYEEFLNTRPESPK